jgi:hypothetical protein
MKGNKLGSVIRASPWSIAHMDVMIVIYEEDHSNPASWRVPLAHPIKETPRNPKVRTMHNKNPQIFDLNCHEYFDKFKIIPAVTSGGISLSLKMLELWAHQMLDTRKLGMPSNLLTARSNSQSFMASFGLFSSIVM